MDEHEQAHGDATLPPFTDDEQDRVNLLWLAVRDLQRVAGPLKTIAQLEAILAGLRVATRSHYLHKFIDDYWASIRK